MPAAETEPDKMVVLAPQDGQSYRRPAPANIAGIESRTAFGWANLDFAKRK